MRVAITAECGVVVTSTFGERYAGFVSGSGKKYGGFFGNVAAGTRTIVPMLDVPASGGPQGYSLGPERWAWSMYPGSNATMSAADGSGFTSFATADPAKGPVVEVGDPVPAGGGFLTSEAVIDGQSSRPRIVYSADGVSKAKLLVPVDASGGEDATAVHAHTHLAWLRGFEKKDLNLYDKVEIWSSPWADDPGAVKPTAITPINLKNVSLPATAFAGGWGRVALNDGGVLRVVSLATKAQSLPPLPDGEHVALVLGVTRTHVWYATAAAKSTTVRRVFRYALP